MARDTPVRPGTRSHRCLPETDRWKNASPAAATGLCRAASRCPPSARCWEVVGAEPVQAACGEGQDRPFREQGLWIHLGKLAEVVGQAGRLFLHFGISCPHEGASLADLV